MPGLFVCLPISPTYNDHFIDRYKEAPTVSRAQDPLDWWRENRANFPRLAILAQKFLCVPATSVASERFFSAAGLIMRTLLQALS